MSFTTMVGLDNRVPSKQSPDLSLDLLHAARTGLNDENPVTVVGNETGVLLHSCYCQPDVGPTNTL